MAILPVNILVEGPTDEVIVKRILEYVGLPYGVTFGRKGKAHLLKLLPVFNHDAHRWNSPWLAVVDLDQKPDCAPDLIREKLPNPAKSMCFRVVVRAIEAWLMADKENLAEYLHVSSGKFPSNPDLEVDPKVTLINLARQSTKKEIREDMVLPEGRVGKVGPGYTGRLTEFVLGSSHPWRPEVAAQCSDSLRRCIEALKNLGNME
jgi:hypothetical protein